MILKQIGNGGAFDYDKVNSSFLIEDSGKYLLFDCGYSVFAELRRLDSIGEISLDKLDTVYISHMDDDHVGSLKTLIYYMFYIKNIRLNIRVCIYISTKLEQYLHDTLKYCNLIYLSRKNHRFYTLTLEETHTAHHVLCMGLLIKSNDSTVFISGDTKAIPSLAEIIKKISLTAKYKIFHDFSNWDNEEQQVHACKSDTSRLYGKQCYNITWYHNGETFDSAWQTI